MNNRILIILGMHRSGTSLITQWLYRCGLHIGENLLEAAIGNEDGHFEDVDFVNLHEEILKQQNLHIHEITESIISNGSFFYRLKKNVEEKNYRKQWGWKDPRTCLFLSHYREILPHAKYLIILRDWNTVVNSLMIKKYNHLVKGKLYNKSFIYQILYNLFRRKKLRHSLYKQNADAYLLVWINYNKALLNHINRITEKNFIVLNYQMLLKASEQIFNFINEEWAFDLSYIDFNSVYKKKLIGKYPDVAHYIKNKNLIKIADELYIELCKKLYHV